MFQRLRHLVIDNDGERVEDAVPTHLLPFAFPHIVRELTGNPRLLEDLRNGQQARALVPHHLTDGHSPLFVMINHAGRRDLGIDEGHATHDAIPLNARYDAVFCIDSVLEGQDDGLIGQDRLDLGQHFVQVIGFDGKDDQVRLWKLSRI